MITCFRNYNQLLQLHPEVNINKNNRIISLKNLYSYNEISLSEVDNTDEDKEVSGLDVVEEGGQVQDNKIQHDSKFVKQSLYVFIIFSLQFA